MHDEKLDQGAAVKPTLKPCPFCGWDEIEIVREGNARVSCILACTNCHCELESSEIGDGAEWNRRPESKEGAPLPTASDGRIAALMECAAYAVQQQVINEKLSTHRKYQEDRDECRGAAQAYQDMVDEIQKQITKECAR